MTTKEFFEKEKELLEKKSCLVCNRFRTKECPRSKKSCPKFQYYLGREAE